MWEMFDPSTSGLARVACAVAMKNIWQRKPQERLWGPGRRVLSGWNIAKDKRNYWKKRPNSWSSECCRSTQEHAGKISAITFYFIYKERENTSIWRIFMQVKCSGNNVREVATYGLTNRRGANIVQHVCLSRYRSRVELGKYGLPPVSCRAPT